MNTFNLIINTSTRRWINPRYLQRLLPCSQIPVLYYMDSYTLDLTLLNADLTPYKIPENADIRFSGDVNRSRSDNLMLYASGQDIKIVDADAGKISISFKCNALAFYEKAGCDMIVSLTINESTVLDDRVFAKRGAYNGEIKDIIVGEEYKPWSEIKAYIDEKADYLIIPVYKLKEQGNVHLELDWSRTNTFDDVVSLYTYDNPFDIYAFDGTVWQPYPEAGIDDTYTYVRAPKKGLFYRYRFTDLSINTVWNPPTAKDIDLSLLTYTDPSGATVKIGGWNTGDKATEMSFQDFAYKLLHPYEAPQISFSISPSKTTYQYDEELYALTMIVNVTKKSKPITAVGFYVNNKVVHLITEGVSDGGRFSYTYLPETPITSTTDLRIEVTDGEKTQTATKRLSWVGGSYFGYIPYNEAIGDYTPSSPLPTSEFIKSQEKILNTSRAYTRTGITTNDAHIMYCYPASFGSLTSITDATGFDYLSGPSYIKYDILLDGVSYYLYILISASSVDDFTQKYV